MKTTLLNPTLWLLAAMAITAAVGAVRRETAWQAWTTMLRYACVRPVVGTLLLMAGAGLLSRAAVALINAGDAAGGGHAATVRRVMEQPPVDASETWAAYREWTSPMTGAAVPWQPVSGIVGCPVKVMASRVPLFTSRADMPMLLVAEFPLARLGPRVLPGALVLLSLGSVAAIGWVLLRAVGLSWHSREGLLLLSAIAGWQPVLAGVRQADMVLPAAGLVVGSWHLVKMHRPAAAGIVGALAACVALPAAGILGAFLRSAPRAALIGLVVFASAVGVTVAVSGAHTIPGFLLTMAYASRNWSPASTNYSVFGRAITEEIPSAIVIGAMVVVAGVSWWRSRGVDGAFACFLTLGLLAAPVLWSQHFALLLVPAVVLLRRVLATGSAVALAACALLLLLFSLPDPAAMKIRAMFPFETHAGGAITAGSAALMTLWLWISSGSESPAQKAGHMVASYASRT